MICTVCHMLSCVRMCGVIYITVLYTRVFITPFSYEPVTESPRHPLRHGGSGVTTTMSSERPPLTAEMGAERERADSRNQVAASFKVAIPEPFCFSRPEEWEKWTRRFEPFSTRHSRNWLEGRCSQNWMPIRVSGKYRYRQRLHF